MYSAYMNEFKVAMATLARYEQDSVEFHNLLLLCQHSPSCEGLSLASYLLTPIQRLPRYELLLKVRTSQMVKSLQMVFLSDKQLKSYIDVVFHELFYGPSYTSTMSCSDVHVQYPPTHTHTHTHTHTQSSCDSLHIQCVIS